MIPRLTRFGRKHGCHRDQHSKTWIAGRLYAVSRSSSRPSPAETLRQRKVARASLKRYSKTIDAARWERVLRGPWNPNGFPLSRGTTAQQLTAMHLEAEAEP
jgi:hypothetical protein